MSVDTAGGVDILNLVGAAALARTDAAYTGLIALDGVEHVVAVTRDHDLLIAELRRADATKAWRGVGRLVKRPGGYSGIVATIEVAFRVHVTRDGDDVRVEFWAPPFRHPRATKRAAPSGADLAVARSRA